MKNTKVVIDTNVFVSSFFGGVPRQIIELWKSGQIIWCLSPPIMDEYIEVLTRMGLGGEPELKEIVDFFAKGTHSLFTHRTPQLHIVEEDPDDDKFIECAVALDAAFVISGDKAVTKVKRYMAIELVTPRGFLDRLKP